MPSAGPGLLLVGPGPGELDAPGARNGLVGELAALPPSLEALSGAVVVELGASVAVGPTLVAPRPHQ